MKRHSHMPWTSPAAALVASAAMVLLSALCHAGPRVWVPCTQYTLPEPQNLPPLMVKADGTRVSSVQDWERTRRPEILDFATKNIYGERPVGRPDGLAFEPAGPDRPFPGIGAVRKRARISFRGPRRPWSFEATIFLPSAAKGPVPVFVLVLLEGWESKVDLDLANPMPFLPVASIVSRGYAVAVYRTEEIAGDEYHPFFAADGTVVLQDPDFTNGVYTCWAERRGERSWGAIDAWAWGASRVMDWLETLPEVDARHVAVIGHSRGGKMALWAAATDTRFAMACVNNSGCCGAKLNHAAVPMSETIQQDNDNNPHWFCRAYRQFNGRDMFIPFDQHWIAALVAPRLLYIASGSTDIPSGPWGEFLTARHASEAWELYGVKGLVEDHPYRTMSPFHEGRVGYHLREGPHALAEYDWQRYMDFADRHGWRGGR